jgi:hypothetical protein
MKSPSVELLATLVFASSLGLRIGFAQTQSESYIKADGDCRDLSVNWLANPNAAPQKEIRTLLGARAPGEMIVSGHCLPGDLDYVTDQLRSFGKRAS